MNNLTRCSLLLNLALLILIGFMLMRMYEPMDRESTIADTNGHLSIRSTISPSFSESKLDVSNDHSPTSAVPATIAPVENNYFTRQPHRPGDAVLDIPGAEGEAAVPAVFAIRNTDANLNSDQLDKVNEIVRDFTHEVSAGNTNPDDPAYLARWQKAQAEADDRLRMVLGQEDYLRYILAAATMDTSK